MQKSWAFKGRGKAPKALAALGMVSRLLHQVKVEGQFSLVVCALSLRGRTEPREGRGEGSSAN